MKVVKKEKPQEEVKVTNLFGDEYAPDEYEFICDDCLAEEVESLKEDVAGLAEDILDHDDVLEMLGEKIQAVEDAQLEDTENLSKVIKILDCMQQASRMLLDAITEQNEEIKIAKQDLKILDSIRWKCIVITFIWLLILTGRMAYDVFF